MQVAIIRQSLDCESACMLTSRPHPRATFIKLATSSDKRNALVWSPSVRLSRFFLQP